MENKTETILRQAISAGSNKARTGAVANLFHPEIKIMSAPTLAYVPDTDAAIVRKKRNGFTGDVPSPLWSYPAMRAPGVFPQSTPGIVGGTNNNAGQAGYRMGTPNAHFHPEADITEAQRIAVGEREMMPHFIAPEHYTYHDKTHMDLQEKILAMAEDTQRQKILHLKNEGFSEEEIKAKLDKEREKAIDAAMKNPTKPSALMAAEIAKQLPTEFREDYPNTSAPPGDIPAPKDMDAYARATMGGSKLQKGKKMAAIRQEQRIRKQVEHVESPLPVKVKKHPHEIVSEIFRTSDPGQTMMEKRQDEMIAHQQKMAQKMLTQESILSKAMEKSLPMAATGDRRNIVTEASMNEMKAMKETMPTGRGRHVQTSLHDFMAKHMKSPEAEVLPSL